MTTRTSRLLPAPIRRVLLSLTACVALAPCVAFAADGALDVGAAARFADLALHCVHLEYPNKLAHTLASDADVQPPRQLTPAFYGCYDWHSSVHGHWLLVRLARRFPQAPFAVQARAALAQSLTPSHIVAEVAYLQAPGRASFERPYGLAWLLALVAELRQWDDPQARQWAAALQPLERAAADRLRSWLPKLHYPIRVGEHSQTAFAFGLVHDWARVAGDAGMRTLIEQRSLAFYGDDVDCPIEYEPSGEDFLSPCLAEADLMRRVLAPRDYGQWLHAFLPSIPLSARQAWLAPGIVTDRSDPKLAHIDGLNLSRAWMLHGIAAGLPPKDRRIAALQAAARGHAGAALPAVTGEHYEGGHWLGTFAVYLTTAAGLPPAR
ncbi:MAG TPA: DUF2891 domain-containing protein [Steroidobacteraceae bacterium]|nr:DUF2891 domain-containing protein [Steroidobacteraceae bacterium]